MAEVSRQRRRRRRRRRQRRAPPVAVEKAVGAAGVRVQVQVKKHVVLLVPGQLHQHLLHSLRFNRVNPQQHGPKDRKT